MIPTKECVCVPNLSTLSHLLLIFFTNFCGRTRGTWIVVAIYLCVLTSKSPLFAYKDFPFDEEKLEKQELHGFTLNTLQVEGNVSLYTKYKTRNKNGTRKKVHVSDKRNCHLKQQKRPSKRTSN